MTVGTRLKEIRSTLGLKQNEFASYFNVPGHKIGDIEQDRHKLPHKFLKVLEEAFNVNIRWLLIGKGDMILDGSSEEENCCISDIQKTLQSTYEIPILCDTIIVNDEENFDKEERKVLIIPKDFLKMHNILNPNLIAYQVESNAMSPEFKKEDVVIIDENQKDIIIDETYLIQYNDKYLLTRAKLTGGQTCFSTDKYQDVYNEEESNVVGKIVAFMRIV